MIGLIGLPRLAAFSSACFRLMQISRVTAAARAASMPRVFDRMKNKGD